MKPYEDYNNCVTGLMYQINNTKLMIFWLSKEGFIITLYNIRFNQSYSSVIKSYKLNYYLVVRYLFEMRCS